MLLCYADNLYLNGEKITIPDVLAVQWQAPTGERALILTNYQTTEVACTLDGKEITLEALNAVVINI